jgi:regulator of RNase E activity RraA
VAPGDLVFGDADGCVVVPRDVEGAVVAAALEKLSGERKTMDALRTGRPLAEVFAEFGIL